MKKDLNKGFTLIELLVVVSIVGLLASLMLASFVSARKKARDAKRKADLAQIAKAVEMYRLDDPGGELIAPELGWWGQLHNQCSNNSWGQSPGKRDKMLIPKYMQKVPEDPLAPGLPSPCVRSDGWYYYYGTSWEIGDPNDDGNPDLIYNHDRKVFILCSKLENAGDPDYKIITNPDNPNWVLNYCLGPL